MQLQSPPSHPAAAHVLQVFDVRMQREMQSYRGHNRDVICATWHPIHEDLFASGAYDGSLIMWQVASPHPEVSMQQGPPSHISKQQATGSCDTQEQKVAAGVSCSCGRAAHFLFGVATCSLRVHKLDACMQHVQLQTLTRMDTACKHSPVHWAACTRLTEARGVSCA